VQARLPQPGSGFEPGCRVSARAALPSKLMILVEEQTRIESTGVFAERSRRRGSRNLVPGLNQVAEFRVGEGISA
jgi:hypothetical protein